ncbi:MAG: hypothetical protein QOF51_2546 [Chloroflexota bacterium]|nr:hypothetical protein [Chloroflexota bacterium]
MTADAILAPLLWAHSLAASAWVGGTLVYILAAPLVRLEGAQERIVWRPFREALRLGIGIFVISGAIMAAQRFASATLPPVYFALLVVKVALGIWMFTIARRIGSHHSGATQNWLAAPERQVLALGVVVYALAITLRTIYETVIRG